MSTLRHDIISMLKSEVNRGVKMSNRYANPPLIEAVCEIRFTEDTPWDPTISGLLYLKVQVEGFIKKEVRRINEIEIVYKKGEVAQAVTANNLVVFQTKEKNRLIQVGDRLISINMLKPYPGWQEFEKNINLAIRSLADVTEITEIKRIGLRYINQLEFPGEKLNFSDYLNFYPFLGEALPKQHIAFITGCVFPFSELEANCKVELKSIDSGKPDTKAMILDIDFFTIKPMSRGADELLEYISVIHDEVEKVFESCITDKSRDIFGRGSE